MLCSLSEETDCLDASRKDLGDGCTRKLVAELTKCDCKVQLVQLDHNEIRDLSACDLANALECNSTLRSLDLDFNYIGDAGAATLARAFEKKPRLAEPRAALECYWQYRCLALGQGNEYEHRVTFLVTHWKLRA